MQLIFGHYYQTVKGKKVQFIGQTQEGKYRFCRVKLEGSRTVVTATPSGEAIFSRVRGPDGGWIFETQDNGRVLGPDAGVCPDDIVGPWRSVEPEEREP